MQNLKPYQSKTVKLKKTISKSSNLFIKNLSIQIEKLGAGKETGYKATIKEINSVIMADSIEEIFSLIPTMLEVSQEKITKKQTLKEALKISSDHLKAVKLNPAAVSIW